MPTDKRAALEPHILRSRDPTNPVDIADSAFAVIRNARDAKRDGYHLQYPAGPKLDQSFEDWAADIASTALELMDIAEESDDG